MFKDKFKDIFLEAAEEQNQQNQQDQGREPEFDQNVFSASAIKWLKDKFGEKYEFIHKPNLSDGDNKHFNASQDGKQFTIIARKHNTEYTNPKDTIIFKIEPDEEVSMDQDEFDD
jgi:hypothetical protein